MRAQPFATLISAGRSGLNATHLPTVLKAEGEQPTEIECHVARANPQWKEFSGGCDALMIFGGPQGYIRPSWYASKASMARSSRPGTIRLCMHMVVRRQLKILSGLSAMFPN